METRCGTTWDTLSIPHSSRLQPQRGSRAFACIYLKLAKLTRLALGGGSVNIMHIAVRAREGPSVRARGMRTGWISTAHPRFDDTRDRSSLSALKCANNRSALAFHLGMPLFRSTNSIRSLFFSSYFSSSFYFDVTMGENVRRYRRRSMWNDHPRAAFFNLDFQPLRSVHFRGAEFHEYSSIVRFSLKNKRK